MKSVIILYGGDSVESEISLQSAQGIIKNIDRTKFSATMQDINDFDVKSINKEALIFIAVHGKDGEDGVTQKLLSKNNIKFTGSDEISTKKCWDKISSKILMVENEIPTPEFQVISTNQKIDLEDEFFLKNNSFFVKPNNNGSSFGVSKVDHKKNLEEAVQEARKYSKDVIIEKAYNSAEYTVGILKGEALQPLEIIAEDKEGFYDYEAKYLSKGTKKVEVIDNTIKDQLKNIALKAFYKHGCQTWGRVDFVYDGKDLGVLEINTVPGFTEKSLFPLAAKHDGIPYQDLISTIIRGI